MAQVPLRGLIGIPGALAWIGIAFGCSGGGASPEAGLDRSDRFVLSQMAPSGSADAASARERPPAMLDGSPISWRTLRTRLAEAAGGAILEEVALDRLLEREARREGVEVTERDLERERRILLETLVAAGAGEDASGSLRALEAVRRVRGLGEARFEALLRRNAILRALVADQIAVTEASIEQMYALDYGERRLARIITSPTLPEAQRALEDLRAGRTFGEVAAERSTDPSARRGGVIEPISPADPSYPAAVRTALERLEPGQTSDPVAIEGGYAILRLDRVLASSDRSIEDLRPVLEERARRRQERLRMGALADRLLEQARITVFDPALGRSWRQRRGASEGGGGG